MLSYDILISKRKIEQSYTYCFVSSSLHSKQRKEFKIAIFIDYNASLFNLHIEETLRKKQASNSCFLELSIAIMPLFMRTTIFEVDPLKTSQRCLVIKGTCRGVHFLMTEKNTKKC